MSILHDSWITFYNVGIRVACFLVFSIYQGRSTKLQKKTIAEPMAQILE